MEIEILIEDLRLISLEVVDANELGQSVEAELIAFGSYSNGLFIHKQSDLNLTLTITDKDADLSSYLETLNHMDVLAPIK